MQTDPTALDRRTLEHAKTILTQPPADLPDLTPLEYQQYKFYTAANLLLFTLVETLLKELDVRSK